MKIPKTKHQIAVRKDRLAQNMIIKRKSSGIPFSLAKIPQNEKVENPQFAAEILNWADGKKDLFQIFKLIENKRNETLDIQARSNLIRHCSLLAKHGYIDIKYKSVLTKEKIKKILRKMGIKSGDRIVVHSSLSSLGYVKGGPGTVCKAFMKIVTKKGTILMPSFNFGGPFDKGGPGYYSPLETPTSTGAIPDYFWRMKDVFRSLNPTHSIAAWGKDAKDYVKGHHKTLTVGENSPLGILEKNGGKVVLIDAYGSNTFYHIVEMTNNVPCLGKRTTEYPVKLPSGKMVKCRSWGWKQKSCEIADEVEYLKLMNKKKMIKQGKIENGIILVFKMKDCRKVIEEYLNGKIKGFSGCKKCDNRPSIIPQTVESDWDEKRNKVKPDTSAFTGNYLR